MIAGGRGDTAIPYGIPMRYLLTGCAALALAWTTLALRPGLLTGHLAVPAVLAVTHLLTLAFATLILLGAMHQLVPVLLVTRLHAPRLGDATFALVAPGAAAIVLGFALGYRVPLLAGGGAAVLTGLLLFDYNLLRTFLAARRRDAVSVAMLCSALYLTLTALLGLLLALRPVVPALVGILGHATPLHLGLGLIGAFGVAIAGAGHRLLSMFVLSHGVSRARLAWLLWAVFGALTALALQTFVGWPLGPIAAAFAIAAAVLFTLDVVAILRVRLRRRIEPPMATYVAGPAFLAIAVVAALAGRPDVAVMAVLVGFVTLSIAGMLVKIVAFLTWQHRFAASVGRGAVPLVKDLTVPKLEVVTAAGLGTGAAAACAATAWASTAVAGLAGVAGATGAWVLALHLAWIAFAPHAATSTAPVAPLGGTP